MLAHTNYLIKCIYTIECLLCVYGFRYAHCYRETNLKLVRLQSYRDILISTVALATPFNAISTDNCSNFNRSPAIDWLFKHVYAIGIALYIPLAYTLQQCMRKKKP